MSAEDFDTITSWPATIAAGRATADGSYPQSWAQGRAVFGGAVTASAYRLARSLVDAARAPLSIDCAFLGPVAPEQPAQASAHVLREGKYMTTVESTMSQNGQACARTLVAFGLPRASSVAIDPPRRALPERGPDALPHLPGVTPTFLQHLEMTWAIGAYPFTGAKEPGVGGYCRHRTAATGVEAILGLLDAWPGPMLPLMRGPTAASTVRWTAHLSRIDTFDAKAHSFFEAEVVAAHDGYASTKGHLYDHDGSPIAWTEQLVAFFEPTG